jgi:hypothetical protein
MNRPGSWQSRRRVSFRVSARVGWYVAGWPWGRLSATPEKIIVSAVLDQALLPRTDVQSVYRGRLFVRRPIAFRTVDHSADWVFVYSPTPRRLLAALAELGWPVTE